MSSPLQHKEKTRIDDSELDVEIDILFNEAIKPHEYIELMQRADNKGLFRKTSQHEIATKILARLHDEMLEKARNGM